MTSRAESLLTIAQSAFADARWGEARAAFGESLQAEVSGAAMFGLAESLWWLGEVSDAVSWRARAVGQLRDEGDVAQAAMAALFTSLDYLKQYGDSVAANGWLAQAARLVDEHDLDPLRGWLLLVTSANSDDDRATAERLARDARQRAIADGDRDLELCAVAQIGASLVAQGHLDEGLRCLDESMAVALSLDGAPDTVVFTSCAMMTSCVSCAEFGRVVQWVRRTIEFTERFGCPFLYAECRIHYGGVLSATGDFSAAERELRSGIEMTALAVPTLHRLALAHLAGLLLDQGRVAEAEQLIGGHEESVEIASVQARVHLRHGRSAAAIGMLRRNLDADSGHRLERSRLHELLGVAELANGNVDGARRLGDAMVADGAALGCDVITARGHRLVGRAAAAIHDADQARRSLDDAFVAFTKLGMVVEAAQTRLLLAVALESAEPEVAAAEAHAALAAADRLGAAPIADETAALLRRLGVSVSRELHRDQADLSRRESQVLDLVGQGLSNPEIAARLHLSRRTVEHHVAHILTKLGVRNRTEAAAVAIARRSEQK